MQFWRRLFIVSVGLVESLLFSGCLFGWPSLLHVLQQEGVYSHLCLNTNESFTTSTISYSTKPIVVASTTEDPTLISTLEDFISEKPEVQDDEYVQFSRKKQSQTEFQHLTEINNEIDEKLSEYDASYKKTCKEQTVQMTLIYTVAAVSYGLTSILIGFSLDYLGLWFTRIGGCILTSGGFFLLAFTTKNKSWLLWPALNLIALGTSQLRLSSFQFANLWPKYRTTILIFYSSAYSISTTGFLLMQIAYVAKIPYETIGITVAVISLVTLPPTFVMPRMKVEDHKSNKLIIELSNRQRKVSVSSISDDVTRFGQQDSSEEDNVPRILKEKREHKTLMNPFDEGEEERLRKQSLLKQVVPLRTSLWTISAALHILWHFITFFLILFYSATFILWIQMMTDDPKLTEHYNKISGICALIAPIFIPIAGLVTDAKIRKASLLQDREEKLALTMQAPALTKAIASLFVLATMICKVFFTPAAIYASMILIAISRPFIVGSCSSYIRLRFHPSHFNRLNGIFTTIVSLFTLTLFPIIIWMKRSTNDFIMAHLFLIGVLVIAFVSPGHMMVKTLARKYARSQLKYRTDI